MPHPLHPAVVHFPIVLAVLIPFVAAFALLVIARGASARSAWSLVLVVAAGLALSSWVAVETGEDQGERVERVVPESAIERHEGAAETLLVSSLVLLVITAGGLAPKRLGRAARVVAVPASVVLLVMAFRVGDSGGQLVYTHGAASAYTDAGGTASGTTPFSDRRDDGEGHREHR